MKKLQECIDKLEKEVDAIGLLCTGEFPELKAKKLLIEPSILLLKTVEALNVSKLGVLVPDPKQKEMAKRKWKKVVKEVQVRSVSPYVGTEEELRKQAQDLASSELIVLDCIGYSTRSKEIVKEVTGKPVLLPRTLMARVIGELGE